MTDRPGHPPIDVELQETVWPAIVEAGVGIGMTPDQIPRVRAAYVARMPPTEALRRGGDVQVEERLIPGPEGAPALPALILRPADPRAAGLRAAGLREQPLPCIYYTANGGKVIRNTRVALTALEPDWVADLGLVLVSVAPRVGPEDPHPAQVEDAYAGLTWIADHAAELGIDDERIIIMGKSGGGGIAAATALFARDRGGPALTHQMLIYPMIDDREVTVSSKFEGLNWDRVSNRTGWSAILGDSAGGPDVSPYAAPARARDLSGLPPAYLETGSAEVFRDEILEYAARLGHAGVPAEVHSWAGGFHAFQSAAPDAALSRAALAARTSYLQRALRTR